MKKSFVFFIAVIFIVTATFSTVGNTALASPTIPVINASQGIPELAGAISWRHINNGLPPVSNSVIHALVADPLNPNIIYAGFSHSFGTAHGIYKTIDGGENWLPADTGIAQYPTIMSLVMDVNNSDVIYAINGQVELYKSTNRGANWAKLSDLPEDVYCVAVNGDTVYVGGYLTIYRSTNGGSDFEPTYSYPGMGTMNAMWVDPGNPAHVIAAWGANLSQTTNSGHSWTEYTLTGCDSTYTMAVAVDPNNHQNMIVGSWNCLMRTTDGGTTWNNVRDIGHVNYILFDPKVPGLVYASSDWLGPSVLLRSTQGGAKDTWTNFDSGLPTSYGVAALALGPSHIPGAEQSAAYVGLSGWGVYTTDPLVVPAPAAFNKSSPANKTTNRPLKLTLSWAASAGADKYYYCYDKTNDGNCTNWKDNGTSTSKTISGLTKNTLYYWQVKAVNPGGTTYANGAKTAFWSFKTGNPPAAFNKIAPKNGALNQPASVTLKWGSSTGATKYSYCIDTTNDNKCTSWVDVGTATSKIVSGLTKNLTYYWQVKAVNAIGTTYANGAITKFWSFKRSTQ